jgi:prevent-host-death family protein
MAQVSVAEAKDQLSRLIDRAMNGEVVTITRHGKPVAQLTPPPKCDADQRRKSNEEILQQLADFRASWPPGIYDSVAMVREIRDEEP